MITYTIKFPIIKYLGGKNIFFIKYVYWNFFSKFLSENMFIFVHYTVIVVNIYTNKILHKIFVFKCCDFDTTIEPLMLNAKFCHYYPF